MIDYSASQAFQPYLFTGERILWTGRPKQGLAFHGSDIFLIPFSLVWTGLVSSGLFTTDPKLNGRTDYMLMIFLILGIYFVIGRFLHDAFLRSKMVYAVTDQRVLVLSGLRSSNLTSLDIHRLPKLELRQSGGQSGTIIFESRGWMAYSGGRSFGLWVPSLSPGDQFFRIDDARNVFELIRNQSRG